MSERKIHLTESRELQYAIHRLLRTKDEQERREVMQAIVGHGLRLSVQGSLAITSSKSFVDGFTGQTLVVKDEVTAFGLDELSVGLYRLWRASEDRLNFELMPQDGRARGLVYSLFFDPVTHTPTCFAEAGQKKAFSLNLYFIEIVITRLSLAVLFGELPKNVVPTYFVSITRRVVKLFP